MEKIEKIKEILKKNDLDAVFLFSTKNDARYSSWLLGVEPLLYHYVCILKNGEIKILEIDYLAESLGENMQDLIYPVDEENLFFETIDKFVNEFGLKGVGVVGLAPYNHFANLNIIRKDLSLELDKLLVFKDLRSIEKLKNNGRMIGGMLANFSINDFANKTEMEAAKFVKEAGEKWATQESFPTSVMSGERLKSATAGLPTSNIITDYDVICLDCGFYLDGVHTDITRMYFGKNSDNGQREEIYNLLVKIQHEVVLECVTGVTLGEISALYKSKFLKYFGKEYGEVFFEEGDLGHSIGFGLHEYPIFIQEENKNFAVEENMIFTLEPEILVEGYRYRVEDMVLCSGGRFEILTK